MDLVNRGVVGVDEALAPSVAEWRGADRSEVTVRDLLEHASGLAARLVDAPPIGRREFEHEICSMPLEYAPRTRSIYSDLGFILLGFLAADRGRATLDAQFARIVDRITPDLGFALSAEDRAAPRLRWRLPKTSGADACSRGEVHDNYAAALGGVAGHSGLFGTAAAVAAFARAMLRAARGARFSRLAVHAGDGSTFSRRRAPCRGVLARSAGTRCCPTSSCGTRMSPSAFGHVGFTGTSLWIDPDRDRYFVLLTNRAYAAGRSTRCATFAAPFTTRLPICEPRRGTAELSTTEELRTVSNTNLRVLRPLWWRVS